MPWVNGLPTYGKWGGPGWSAGREGTELTQEDYKVPGVDSLDNLFKKHDLDYDKAEKLGNQADRNKAILQADLDLLWGMWFGLDPNDPNRYQDPAWGETYRNLAIDAFTEKILAWDIPNVTGCFDLANSIENILSPATAAVSTSNPNTNDNTYRIVYYDPLVLDLDGDGIETVSGAQGSGVLFDQNADGIRTTSGWLNGDDGLLVRDINGNGTIDTGAELFGDSTRLQNGATAANGFAALTDLDSNHDGQVNNQDSAFNELRVWRDVDQDGVTDTGELFTLDEVGVSSLNTQVFVTPNTTLDGGIQAETGSFTWTNGSTGVMADRNFTEDTFHSQYTTAIDIPVELQNLPNIAGMDRLRDLREAAALSPALANVLTLYSAACAGVRWRIAA